MKNKTMPSVQQHLATTNNQNIQQQHHNHSHHHQHHQQYRQQMQANHQHPQQIRQQQQQQHQIDASQHHHHHQQQQPQMQQLLPSVPMIPHQQLSAMGASSGQPNEIVGAGSQPSAAGATSSSNQTVSSSSSSSSSSSNFVKKDMPANGKKTKGRVRIKMEFIHNKLRRYTTFSKRKTGIMKKAFELATLTGTQVMLLVASETGHVYTFATRKLQPMIISDAGKALIQTCLNSPDSDNLLMSSATSASNSQQHQNGTSVNNNPSSASSSPPAAGGPSLNQAASGTSNSLANNQLQLSPASSNLQLVGQQQEQAHQQHNSSNSSSAVHSPLASLQPLSSPSQQQQSILSTTNNNNNNNHHQTNSKQHPASAPHLMGPTAGAVGASVNNPIGIQSQHNVLLATSASNSQQPTNGPHQPAGSGASTTDQRMSATGFEEPELSYSISDLDDRMNLICEDSILETTFTTANLSAPSTNDCMPQAKGHGRPTAAATSAASSAGSSASPSGSSSTTVSSSFISNTLKMIPFGGLNDLDDDEDEDDDDNDDLDSAGPADLDEESGTHQCDSNQDGGYWQDVLLVDSGLGEAIGNCGASKRTKSAAGDERRSTKRQHSSLASDSSPDKLTSYNDENTLVQLVDQDQLSSDARHQLHDHHQLHPNHHNQHQQHYLVDAQFEHLEACTSNFISTSSTSTAGAFLSSLHNLPASGTQSAQSSANGPSLPPFCTL